MYSRASTGITVCGKGFSRSEDEDLLSNDFSEAGGETDKFKGDRLLLLVLALEFAFINEAAFLIEPFFGKVVSFGSLNTTKPMKVRVEYSYLFILLFLVGLV